MEYVYLVLCDYNVKGDAGHEILSAHKSYRDACFALAEEVKSDLQYGAWLECCKFFEMKDENNKEISENEPVPDYISYFEAKDDDFAPERYEELWVKKVLVLPISTDTIIEESND